MPIPLRFVVSLKLLNTLPPAGQPQSIFSSPSSDADGFSSGRGSTLATTGGGGAGGFAVCGIESCASAWSEYGTFTPLGSALIALFPATGGAASGPATGGKALPTGWPWTLGAVFNGATSTPETGARRRSCWST